MAVARESKPKTADFQGDQVVTIAFGHFVHDTFSAFVSPLLPLLRARFNTGYGAVGGLAGFMQFASILNPLVGYIADRVSLRYFIILAPAITATLMSLIGLAPTYLTLVFLLLATGISVAAFHAPAPAMIGRISGDRIGLGMSIFMASGELGRTIGPLLVVAAVQQFALEGIWRLLFVGWAVSVILYWRLRHIDVRPVRREVHDWAALRPRFIRFFLILGWLSLARVFMLMAITVFLPTFMTDVRLSGLGLAAVSLSILEGAGVVGAMSSGTLSDRFGRRPVLLTLTLIAPFLLAAFVFAPGEATIPLLIALGLIAISPTPVILAAVQDAFPDNRAFANGNYLALNFLTRASAAPLLGLLADEVGLQNAFLISAVLALLAVPAVLLLPLKTAPSRRVVE